MPRPVVIASPGVLSDADYAQLVGLAYSDKIAGMRAILAEVAATRTLQQQRLLGAFTWVEGVGQGGEYLFVGSAPPTLQRHTIVVIMADGKVYKMMPSGLAALIAHGPPKIFDYDLRAGNGVLMAT